MLWFLFLILKIVLILILSLISIVIVLILVLLFSLAKVKVEVFKEEETFFRADFKWLFGIVTGFYEIKNEDISYQIKVLSFYNESYSSKENSIYVENEDENICNDKIIQNKRLENIQKSSKINIIWKNILKFLLNIKEKLEYLKNFNKRYCILDMFNATIELIIKLFKAFKFKSFNLNLVFGFDDPYETGKVLGFLSAIKPFLPEKIFFDGDFNNRCCFIEGKALIKTNLCAFVFPLLKYFFSKPIFSFMKDYWRGELDG